MSLTDALMVAAVLLAPLIAIQVSVFLEIRREKRQRRLKLFRTLMMTRAARLVPDHVNALNMIDIEFSGTDAKSKEVRAAVGDSYKLAWQRAVAKCVRLRPPCLHIQS